VFCLLLVVGELNESETNGHGITELQ